MNITFAFKGKTFTFTRDTLDRWMSTPLGSKRIDLMNTEQAEAAFDLVTSKEDLLSDKECSLLEQMGPRDFAKLFTVTEDAGVEQ